MGGAKAVEKVQKGHPRLEGRHLGDGGKVLGFLHRKGRQQRKSGRAGAHHIRVVAENRQRMGGDGPRRDMETKRQQLAGDLVQVGDHQQEPLGSGERGGDRSGLERTVHRSRGTPFGLKLDDDRHLTPKIGPCLGRPGIGQLAHGRCRGDGINRDHLVHPVGHRSHRFVGIEGDKNRQISGLFEHGASRALGHQLERSSPNP